MSSNKNNTNMRKLSFLGFNRRSSSDGHGASTAGPDEVQLDDEMEKVFAMADTSSDKFDVAQLSTSPESSASPRHMGEREYSLHRKKSYPHMHVPLKAMHSRTGSKRGGHMESPSGESEESEHPDGVIQTSNGDVPLPSSETFSLIDVEQDDDTVAEDGTLLSSESEPQVSERAAYSNIGDSPIINVSPDARRVQFTKKSDIGDIPEDGNDYDDNADDKKRRKSRHHHAHHHKLRKYSLQEDPESRRKSGADRPDIGPAARRVSIQPEDATLEEADLDELTSHRSDDPRGLRRHKIQSKGSTASFVHIARKDGEHLQNLLPPGMFKKMYDHSPHEIFVQLDELHGVGEEREWKETARWIKYEEDVEEGADRWGRPHVASLSFHSLLNLRRCLETGVVLLDLEEKDLPGVAYRVVEQMVVDELILEDDKAVIMRALLLRHRHVNEHERGFHFGPRRKYSSYTSLQNLAEGDKGKPRIVPSAHHMDTISKNGSVIDPDRLTIPETHIDMKEETYSASSQEDLKKTHNETIFKRIPLGAEATTVLVGAVEFLDQPTIAFVRLAEGVIMPSITEVPIPVRFMFILLGPANADLDYHEVGRSIATLMANQSFHQIAYKADDRKELLSAINEFLDDSIVLPPGDWERQALLPFDEIKAKSDMIRSRKNKSLQQKNKINEKEDEKKLLAAAAAGGDDGKKPPTSPLERTKKPFGGLINDLKRRYPFYKSDILDALNSECLAATIFMYFAALSTAITFGGLSSDKTHNLIGISETLVSASATGIIFALTSGQPLLIIGTTGPLLLFDESLYQFCISNGIHFLTTRVFVGLWMGLIALVVASVEGSVLVKLFTRFTQEIFTALIVVLYIVESMMKVVYVFSRHPILANYCVGLLPVSYIMTGPDSNDTVTNSTESFSALEDLPENATIHTVMNQTALSQNDGVGPINQPNTALFCAILSFGTFAIAYYLRLFRNSHFLGRNARRALGDFGVPIAIVLMVLVDFFVPQTYTEKLSVPEGISPSDTKQRGWFISPSGPEGDPFPLWVAFASVVPAMLVYILIFMETHISELIIDKPERKLKKGSGFHMDIVVISLMNIGCGFFGAPWHCAASVRSVTHVSAVTIMSRTHAPGDKPHITEVKEQRLSGLFVSLLVGLSVLMAPLLRLIPMAVLFGVFLYMGVASTSGIQFFERLRLFFMPVKHHPQVPYVRRVPTYKMHLFTIVQVLALAMLWAVKSSRISLAFPFFLIMMVPIRQKMGVFFSALELRALDGSQPDAGAEDEPDFYEQAPLPG